MERQRNPQSGKFYSESKPNRFKLTLRIPDDMALELKDLAGQDVAQWVREAIAQKLEREKQRETA